MKSLYKIVISIVVSSILLSAGIGFAKENKDGKVV